MATEDDKPQTIFATDLHLFLQETEKEVKELHTIGTPVSNHPLAEIKQVEPLHNDTEGSYESENCEMNTEPDSSNQKKAECGGSVKEESSRHSIEPTSAHSAEVNNVGRGAYFEEGGMRYNFNSTTASFEGDPHETSFQAKEANFPKISSITDDMKLDFEILHSTVSEIDEITGKGNGSDLSESTSTQTVCQSDRIEEAKENAQIAEIQPAGHVMTLTMTDARAGTAGLGVTNYEVKSTHGTTDGGNEKVGISCHYEYPNNEDDKKEKENRDSNTEQPGNRTLVAKSMDETMSKNKDSDNVEQLEGKSSTKTEGIQDTNILSQDMEEIMHNQLEILGTGCLECSISERGSSSYDRPESVRAVSDILSMSEKESQTKENHGDDTEETVQEKDEVSSGEHNSASQGSHSMESKSGEHLEVKNVISMCPKEVANCVNDQKIRGNNVGTDLEEGNRSMTESVKDNSSVQEFQMISIDNNAVDEANNPVLLPVQNNGKEASETGGKEHVSEVDDPAPIEYEDRRRLSIGKKTEDENSHNSDDTSKDREQLAISQSLGKENQPNKEDRQYEEATTPFMSPDEPLQSKADIENPQVFTIAEETEINEDKLQGEPILIEQSNEMQDILLNDHSLEKIGNKHRSREDSSCCSPLEVINQKSKQEDDLKLEVNPGVKADGTFVGTNNTKSSTKFEEPETSDATESFKIEMPTEEKFVEGPSQVLAADETAKFGTGEGKEIGSENNKTTYDDFKQEVEPEAKPNESTNNASQTSKTEEPETIYSTQSLEKQISDEEQVIEGHHQTAEERLNDHLPEDKREKNDIDTETEDELKPEVKTGLSTDEVSDTVDEANNSKKFKEAGTIEAMQSLNNHLLSNKKVGEGPSEIAERLENYSPAEVGKEKRNVKVTTEAAESKPEIYTGQKFEEPEVIEATQRINTPMSSEEQVAKGPMQVSVTENVVNYCTAEERKEKRKGIDTTGDDLNSEVDPEVKVNEVSATTSNANQSKKFEETEIYDAAQSFKKQCPPEEKGLEGAYPVSTAEEKVNYSPAEKEEEERDVKDTAMQEELNPELATGLKLDELSESIRNASTSTKFQEPEPIDVTQTVNKQISHEEKVIEQADQVSTPEEIVNYHLVEEEENVKDTTTADDLQPEVDPGVRANEIFDTKDNASESTKSLNQKRREDKVVDRPPKVSTAEAANYCSPDVKDEDNVKDATLSHELNPDVDQGKNDTKASETTENACENTKFEDSETVDATQSFNQQMTREEKVVDGPPKVSTAEEAVNYCCAEEVKEEDRVKDATLSHDLNPHVVQEENATKESETTENASESTKVEQPHCIEFSQNFKKDVPHEDEIVEGLHLASTKEETVNYCNAEEVKAEGYVKETTTRDELKQELDSKLQVSENIEAIRVINADMETQDDVIEGAHQVSIVENVGNYRPAEERKEDNVDNTTGDKLSTIIKLEETTGTDVAEILEKDSPRKDKVNEEPSQLSAGEEPANYNPAEGGKERNINDAGTQDELKPEVAPGVKLYEIYEDVNESESTKFQQPEPSDTTQSVSKQIKEEDKVVERSPGTSPADKLVNDHLADGGEVKHVKDRTPADENLEAKPKTESGMMADEISETHYASECTKLTEAKTVDATDSFQEEQTKEGKVVEGPPKVSTAEQTITDSPGEEEKEERNLNVTTITDKLKPELDPGEISPTIDNASQITKFKGPEIVDVSPSFKKEMPSEDEIVERPPQVPTPEEVVSYSPDEEGKTEVNVKETTNRDDLNPEADHKMEEDEISESTNSTSKTTEFELPENIEAIKGVNTQMPREDKIAERSIQVSIAMVVGICSEEIKDKSVDTVTGDESPTRIKLEGYRVNDTNQSLEKKITSKDKVAEQPFQVSTAKEQVNDIPGEGKEERNVTHAAIQDELQPEVAPGIKPDDASRTMMNASGSIKFQEPEPIDAAQSIEEQITSKDKDVEGLHHVSTIDEIVNYHHADEGEEKNVKDKAIIDELKLKVESGVKADEVSETHYASESTKFKEAETVDATSGFQEEMPKEDKVVEGPARVSTTEAVVSYSQPEEKREERNVKNTTIRDELKGEVNSHVTVSEVPETIENASENAKFKGSEPINVTQSFNKEVPIEDKVVEGPPQVSIAEETVYYSHAEEGNAERNTNETATKDEQKARVNPEIGVEEISLTTKSESESTQFEVPERIEAAPDINKKMPSEDKVVKELSFQVSIAEHVGNYGCTEERNEDTNVTDTTADKLATGIKLEETEDFKKQIPTKDQVVDGTCQVSTAVELVNFSSTEEGKEESRVMDVSKQAELNPEVAPEIKSNETSETPMNASESTKFQEPETIDATKSSHKQMTYEDRDVEGSDQISTVEGIDNYNLAQQEWNVQDTRTLDELKPEEDPGAWADTISETTYCASRSIKFEEPDAVHANHSFKIGMPADKVVKEPPQVSTAEDKVNYSPEEERKEETNDKYTKSSDDLPGLIVNASDVINDASQNTKNCNDQLASEDEGVEGPPQVSTAEEILSYSPTEEGKEESSVKDTSAIDELKTRVCPKEKLDEISEPTNSATETTKFEEPEIIDAAQSSKKQILSEENVVGGYCEVLTAKEIKHYTLGEKVEETNVNDTSADELNTEEDIRGMVDEISVSTNNARETTKRFKKQKPSADKVVEEPHQDPIMVETVQYSPAEEEKDQRCTMDTTTKSELQEKADKLPRRNTETEVATSNEKVEIPGVWSPKYDEGVKGSNYQEKIFKYDSEVTATASSKKFGEYIVSEAELLKPVHEMIGDYPKSEDVAKEDINTLESHKDDIVTHYSPSESLHEMTNATGGLVLEKQEGGIDKAVSLLLSGTSRDEESNKLDKEEQYRSITQKESRKEVSSIAKGSGIKDKEKEEKVEGQESLPTWISVTKLDGDANITKSENEDKKFHNQSKNSDFPFTGQESAREFQGNIKELQRANDFNLVASKVEAESGRERKASDECEDMSSYIKSDLIPEVKVMERPIEEILTKAECKEDKGQVDKIAQKGGLADLTQATNNSEDINMPYKSSIIMSDLVIMAKEDPETGIERQLLTEDKDISLMQKGQKGETLQPETEELKPGDASQAAAEAVKEEYGEKERLNNDCNDETQKFRSAISEENSASELVPEQDDREAQGQQKTINQSRLEVTRKEGPFDPVTEMDTSHLLNMQKHEGGPCCDSDKQEGGGDPNDSLIDNKNLPVQETESICAGKEDQEPVTCNKDKETEKATGGLILEEKTTTSLPNLHEVSKNENSQVSGDIISESKQTIRREGMKTGITGTSEPKEPNTDEAKDEEGEEDKQQREELGYDHPIIVEASRDIHVKASPKKSHSILSGVGSKVKHSIAKVKKAITGKSSHPKPSSPK